MTPKLFTGVVELHSPILHGKKKYPRAFSTRWMIYGAAVFPNLSRITRSEMYMVHRTGHGLGMIFPASNVKRFLNHMDKHEAKDDTILNLDTMSPGATAPGDVGRLQ